MTISGMDSFTYKNEYLSESSINILITYPNNLLIKEKRHNLIYEITKTAKFDSENYGYTL